MLRKVLVYAVVEVIDPSTKPDEVAAAEATRLTELSLSMHDAANGDGYIVATSGWTVLGLDGKVSIAL